MKDNIYTHDEAAVIIELFEDVLSSYDICVPSPEDDERDPEDMQGLYGSTYSDLLDAVEERLISMLDRHQPGAKVKSYMFSGTV